MEDFCNYLDQKIPLPRLFSSVFVRLNVSTTEKRAVISFLEPLRIKDAPTYDHSIRVGILNYKIASFMHLDRKALSYPGFMHDLGKILTNPETLKKKDGWTAKDSRIMKAHVIDAFQIIRGKFDFTADVIKLHHFFQDNPYPALPPPFLHNYSNGTKATIQFYARLLGLSDSYDALHRVNAKFGMRQALSGKHIKELMLQKNPDQKVLLTELYKAEIFTTKIFS